MPSASDADFRAHMLGPEAQADQPRREAAQHGKRLNSFTAKGGRGRVGQASTLLMTRSG